MKNVWYYEDRKLPSNEQKQAMTETKSALENSTLMTRLLKGIIEKEIESTYVNEEDYTQSNYAEMCSFNAGKRKALKNILKILP
jgi:hypothetical protein